MLNQTLGTSGQSSYPHMHKPLSILEYALDLLLPKRCVGCKKFGVFLCNRCIEKIPLSQAPKEPYISAVFDYRHRVMKNAMWMFKYKNVRAIARCFGECLYDEVVGDLGESIDYSKGEAFLVIPIPLHSRRLRERGYNQSELIARALTQFDRNKIFVLSTTALTRIRATKPQAKSDRRSTRLVNLCNVFRAESVAVNGKNIILVDDVTTTGATLSEARKALLHAGARSVRAYAVAH